MVDSGLSRLRLQLFPRKLSLLLILATFGLAPVSLGAGKGEPAPVFLASDILPPAILRSRDFKVAERVPVVDYLYDFKVKTPFGVIPAHGMEMLKVRVQEARSLSRAARMREDSSIMKSAWKSFRKTGEGLELLITNPDGVVLNAPRGLFKFVNRKISDFHVLGEKHDRSGNDMRRRLAAELNVDPETSNPILRKFLDEAATKRKIVDLLCRMVWI